MATIALFLLSAASLAGAQGADRSTSDAKLLMASLEGRWSCAGAFASGRPLHAQMEFSRDLGGEGLRFHHADLPPTSFVADALWSIDKGGGQLVSLAWTGMQGSSGRSPAAYLSDQLSATSARLVQTAFLRPPFAPNRFTYSVSSGQLAMKWEVQRAGQWTLGDYLRCVRLPGPRGSQGH